MKREGRIFSELLVLHRRCWFNTGFCTSVAGQCNNQQRFAHIFVSNKSNKLPGNFYRSQSTSNLDTV